MTEAATIQPMTDELLDQMIEDAEQTYPQLYTRYRKGAGFYRRREVHRDGNIIYVKSGEQVFERYGAGVVHSDDTVTFSCACEDFRFHAPTINRQRLCRHVIAARLWVVRGEFPGLPDQEPDPAILADIIADAERRVAEQLNYLALGEIPQEPER